MASSDRDWERVFVGDRQICVSHFYQVGRDSLGPIFAAGFTTPDGFYTTGLYAWRDERFAAYGATPIGVFRCKEEAGNG